MSLPTTLYTAQQVRELDRIAIQKFSIPGYTLMTRAAQSAFDCTLVHWPAVRRIAVFCGLGNNAGDGYVYARLAQQAGLQVTVYQLGQTHRQQGDALRARQEMEQTSIVAQTYGNQTLHEFDLIVDGIFGTGLDRDVSGPWAAAISDINDSNKPVLALDIPSGLQADTGEVMAIAIRATVTISFIGLKQGLFTAWGPDYRGQIVFNDLSVPPEVYAEVPSTCTRLAAETLINPLATRQKNSHKGRFGHVLLLGGNQGMVGAIMMAAMAAARIGAGRVSVVTHANHANFANAAQPEIMTHGFHSSQSLEALLERADVIVLGPGLGQDQWAKALFNQAIHSRLPLIIDADALLLLAQQKAIKRSSWILTPHPGEAAALLACTSSQIQQHRFAAVTQLQARYGGVVVLKGAGSIVGDGQASNVCDAGNPGMASGGMGDILSGMLGGLLGQSLHQSLGLINVASFAVMLHAKAGDRVAETCGQRGMLATDLLPVVRSLVNGEQWL